MKAESSAYNMGLKGAVNWQRGQQLPSAPEPKPNEDYPGARIRDWVRGWNAGVASGAGKLDVR